MKNAAKTKPASLKAFQNALDRQEAYTKYGFTTEAEIKALQEKEDTDAAVAAYDAAALAEAEQAPAAAPVTTWRDEIAGEIFPNGLADQGLDRLDFASISKTTLKRMIDRAYTRGLAEATRDARLPHNR